MKSINLLLKKLAWVAGLCLAGTGSAMAQQASTLLGTNCDAMPIYHCQDATCSGATVTQPGNTVEPKTRRTFFLDCPAGYKAGDKVNLVLSLHGGGSYANWQRNYWPIMDVKDKYKLVIMTPGSPYRAWDEGDDEYLQNIVDLVVGTVGKENVERFILAGHSWGGATSSRIVCTDYWRDKVDVRISLSGGRVGPVNTTVGFGGLNEAPVWRTGEPQEAAAPRTPRGGGALAASGPPGGDCDYSFIYSTGEYENTPAEESPLAEKYSCKARVEHDEVLDPKAGYVWDSTRQDPGSDGWGHYPRSGRAKVYEYPNCKDGRIVADIVKLKKGHTEGYEPNLTDKMVEMALKAKGGKIKKGKWNPPAPPEPRRGLF